MEKLFKKEQIRLFLKNKSIRKTIRYGLLEIIAQFFIFITVLHLLTISGERGRYFVILIIFIILETIGFRNYSSLLSEYSESKIADIRYSMMEKVGNTDLPTFERVGAEQIYTILTYDVGEISVLSREIAQTGRLLPLILILIIRLASLSFISFIVAFLFLFSIFIVVFYVQLKVAKITARLRYKEKKLFDAVSDLLDGFKELKLNDKKSEDFFNFCFISRANELMHFKLQRFKYFLYSYLSVYIIWFFSFFILIVSYFISPYQQEIIITSLGMILLMPKAVIYREIPKLVNANISFKRILDFENILQNLKSESFQESQQTDFKEIKYDNISFSYHNSDNSSSFSVGPVSIDLYQGEILFITGGNGAGKTTILKLMTGLYPIDSGEIYLDGKNIRIEEYRPLFSAVFSDFHLFDRLYGLESIDEKGIDSLLEIFKLDQKVQLENDAFSTRNLSTGQKKRLALLMAMLEDKPIYFFDEWAADQDPEFRRYFYENLLPSFKKQGKTVIAVTHDDRFFYAADRVLNLEYGQIAQKTKIVAL